MRDRRFLFLEVMNASEVFIVEGEKDADNIKKLGLTSICNPRGDKCWDNLDYLSNKDVYIIPNKGGREHALQVAQSLKGKAHSIKIIELQGSTDISAWIANESQNKTSAEIKAELLQIAKETPEWKEKWLTKLSDLMKEPEEEVAWLLDGILPMGGMSILAAKPKTGKSTLARNLALSVVRGEEFLGRGVAKGPAIYLSLEEKRSEIRKHFQDMGANGSEDIFVFTGTILTDTIEKIKEAISSIAPVLIVIDPLFKFLRVNDGNDYQEVTTALDPLLQLARGSNTHVMLIHHLKKGEGLSGDSVLGSTAIFASADTLLLMRRTDEYRTIKTVQRYGADLDETILKFNSTSRTFEMGKSKEAEEIETAEKQILDVLTEEGQLKEQILSEIETRAIIKRKAFRGLIEKGLMIRDGTGSKGDPFTYRKNSMMGCPNIIRDIESENHKNHVNPCQIRENSMSQEIQKNVENGEILGHRIFSENEGIIDLKEVDFEVVP